MSKDFENFGFQIIFLGSNQEKLFPLDLIFIIIGHSFIRCKPVCNKLYIYICAGANSHGPITQNAFLHKMGIRERTEVRLTY